VNRKPPRWLIRSRPPRGRTFQRTRPAPLSRNSATLSDEPCSQEHCAPRDCVPPVTLCLQRTVPPGTMCPKDFLRRAVHPRTLCPRHCVPPETHSDEPCPQLDYSERTRPPAAGRPTVERRAVPGEPSLQPTRPASTSICSPPGPVPSGPPRSYGRRRHAVVWCMTTDGRHSAAPPP